MAQNVQQMVQPIVFVDSDTDYESNSEPESERISKTDVEHEIVHAKKFKCRLRDTVFEELYQSREITGDITFVVQCKYPRKFFQFPRPSIRGFYRDVILFAHKSILAAGSPIFHEMFYGRHKNMETIQILDHDQCAFRLFLESFYSDSILFDERSNNIYGVLELAKEYEVTQCMEMCINAVKKSSEQ